MCRIRLFTPDDIPRVAVMISRTFSYASKMTPESISHALDEVLFHNPWIDEEYPSLVYEHSDGIVRGFLGVSARPMTFNGKRISAVITHNYVVEPGPHAAVAGIRLFKTLLNGSQDLIISGSAGDRSKFITEKNGGTIGYLYSTGWRLPVRPFRSGLEHIGQKWEAPRITRLLKPAVAAGENLLGRMLGEPFRYDPPEGTYKFLTAGNIVEYQNKYFCRYSLRPEYTSGSLQWVLDIAGKATHLGDIKCIGFFDSADRLLGWAILFLNPGGRCEVLQMVANEGKETPVMKHLVFFAWEQGATELIGRMEPPFMRALSKTWSLFVPGRMWMLLCGKNPEVISAICRGDAFISRLEDDLWLL